MSEKLTIEAFVEQTEMPEEVVEIFKDGIVLMPGDSMELYLDLCLLMTIDLNPQNYTEWLAVFDLAALWWDLPHYRKLKKAVLQHVHAEAVESALLITAPGYPEVGPKPAVRAQARLDALEWKRSDAAKEKFRSRLAEVGYDFDSLQAAGFSAKTSTLAAIEQLLSSTRRQINLMFAGLYVRREFCNRAQRFASQQILLEASVKRATQNPANGV